MKRDLERHSISMEYWTIRVDGLREYPTSKDYENFAIDWLVSILKADDAENTNTSRDEKALRTDADPEDFKIFRATGRLQ